QCHRFRPAEHTEGWSTPPTSALSSGLPSTHGPVVRSLKTENACLVRGDAWSLDRCGNDQLAGRKPYRGDRGRRPPGGCSIPAARSSNRTRWSLPPETSSRPSGEMAIEVTPWEGLLRAPA